MDKVKRFFECLVPITSCNLRCSYCYVIQKHQRDMAVSSFRLSPENIGKAFSRERVGGVAYISLCGMGETLIQKEMPDIIYYLLKQGHFINVTNNGTMGRRFDDILMLSQGMLDRLHFAFSFHYVELKRANLLDSFVENVKRVRRAGCSILVQLNLADEYIACIDEIKSFCVEHFGAYPQTVLTRKEGFAGIFSSYSFEDYCAHGRSFKSPLFDFTVKNFMQPRHEFCYAGDWAFVVNLATGAMKSCYDRDVHQNLYDDLSAPIKSAIVGNSCKNRFCINSSHFMSLGVIPEILCPTYGELRNRKAANWYGPRMELFLNSKLQESNQLIKKT